MITSIYSDELELIRYENDLLNLPEAGQDEAPLSDDEPESASAFLAALQASARSEEVIAPDDLRPEDIFPTEKDEQTILMPTLQNMQDYIVYHYKRVLFRKMNEVLLDEARVEEGPDARIPVLEDLDFTGMKFVGLSRTAMQAVVWFKAHILQPCHQAVSRSYTAWLLFDMNDRIALKDVEIAYGLHRVSCDLGSLILTEHLTPYLSKENIELYSTELLRKYNPAGLENQEQNTARALAGAMGLQIMYLRLYKNKNTRSFLVFHNEFEVKAEITGPDDLTEQVITMKIPPNTIVINSNAISTSYTDLYIYHECAHWEWHHQFYLLQDMHNNDLRKIRREKTVRLGMKKAMKSPLSWIEYHARQGSYALMMPRSFMTGEISQRLHATRTAPNEGWRYDVMIRALHDDYSTLPKSAIKTRLVQLGHIGARGALNYVNCRYIDPFAFDHELGKSPYTYVISLKQAMGLYQSDKHLQEQINSGRFVYADGHICLNHPDLVRRNAEGSYLTNKALNAIDRCCLRFHQMFTLDDGYQYQHGCLHCDRESENYLYFPPREYTAACPRPDVPSQITLNANYLKSLPDSFGALLTRLMKDCHVTREELEYRTGISVRTLARWRTDDSCRKDPGRLADLIIALHLPPWVSERLIRAAGLQAVLTDAKFMPCLFAINCMYMDNLNNVHYHLNEMGVCWWDNRSDEIAEIG